MAHVHETHSASGTGKPWGIMAEFANPATLSHAAEHIRAAGFKKWDVYSPFPVHGMDEAMGLKPSRVTIIMGFMCVAGFSAAILMQWWMGQVDYPITFELSVLFSAFGAVFGMLILNLLPRWHHPLFDKNRFLRVSDDRFIIAIEADDPKFNDAEVRRMFEKLGGTHIDHVEDAA